MAFIKESPRFFLKIQKNDTGKEYTEPHWINNFLPGLDAIALYYFLSNLNSERYFEIGSGNSTKFARKAITDQHLQTRITSIDPFPRDIIDTISDFNVRKPLEELNLECFKKLKANDILFIDNSHRLFTNSDVCVVFLEILPLLSPGVYVQFHDIFLPFDYPPQWSSRYYSEQYIRPSADLPIKLNIFS